MPGIEGIAHIQLTVSDMERAVPFYETLLHSLERVTLIKRRIVKIDDDTRFTYDRCRPVASK
jgi:hypothetical protein